MKKQQNNISKPQPFIAPGSEKKLTEEELKKRQVKFERLEKIGENHTVVKGDDYEEGETENPYRIQAMIMINQDKDVPEELIKQIEEYDKEILKMG